MNSRNQILSAIRQQTVPDTALPDLSTESFQTFPDPVAQFQLMVTQVGGTSHEIESLSQMADYLDMQTALDSQRVVSLVDGFPGNLSLDEIDQPAELNQLELAVLPGRFGVAENGAVWISDQGVSQRAVWFLAEHLVLVVPRSKILQNMHAAYHFLDSDRSGFGDRQFGCFISGPSKTADIEQSLVIGAQGPTQHTVFVWSGE